jgi:UPF0716 protein FxsA
MMMGQAPTSVVAAYMRFLFLLFIVVPFVELYLLLWVARWVGFLPTLALTIVTGVVGASLAKREGLKVYRQWQQALQTLQPPPTGLVQGALILVGGAFLLTPGILTDVAGMCLLLPLTREPLARWVRKRVDRYIEVRSANVSFGARTPADFGRDGGFINDKPSGGGRTVIDTTGQSSD